MKRGRYYLGRVKKHGMLDNTKFMDAINNASTVNIGKFSWTIIDVEDGRNSTLPYVFGFLAKFSFEGHAPAIDTEKRSSVEVSVPNHLIAKTPFLYLPQYSGISYMHAWNGISEEIFPDRFQKIIKAAYGNFFVDCTIDPISDYRAFSTKLKKLQKIKEINARVHPPNPLFGRLWGSLNNYIDERNATEISVRETSDDEKGLKTKLIELIKRILEDPKFEPTYSPAIADAAVLMAADGYGRGQVTGEAQGEEIVVRTSETQKSFLFSKIPIPEKLAILTDKSFSNISTERDMTHR